MGTSDKRAVYERIASAWGARSDAERLQALVESLSDDASYFDSNVKM